MTALPAMALSSCIALVISEYNCILGKVSVIRRIRNRRGSYNQAHVIGVKAAIIVMAWVIGVTVRCRTAKCVTTEIPVVGRVRRRHWGVAEINERSDREVV